MENYLVALPQKKLPKNYQNIDKKKVELNDVIKSTGKYNVKVKLHTEVTVKCVINVVAK